YLYRPGWRKGARRQDTSTHPQARDPSSLERRVDNGESARAPSGDRERREGPQAVPLPSSFSGDDGEHKIRPYARVRGGSAANPQQGQRASRAAEAAAREGHGHCRVSFGDDTDPGRKRQLREGEQQLWPHYASQQTRERGGLPTAVSFQGQERQDMEAAG